MRWPIREEHLLTVTHFCESSKSLEGDYVWIECDDATFEHHFKNVHTRNSSLIFSKFCKQGGKMDYSRYSQVSLITLCYH